MKNKIILTVTILAMLTITTVSAAVLQGETAGNIKVIIDGKMQDFKDANGGTVEPVIINGTTYLPLRSVADAFGKSVAWDEKTSIITIGENNSTTSLLGKLGKAQGTYLSKVTGEVNLDFQNIGDVGAKFQEAVKIDKVSNYDEGGYFPLDGSYKTMSCTLLFVPDSTVKAVTVKIKDKDKGVEVLNRKIDSNTLVQVSDIDISGIKNIAFYGGTNAGFGSIEGGTLYFLNPTLK